MHLKTKNYSVNEITEKRTLSQNLNRSMSSFSRQRNVSVVQMSNNQFVNNQSSNVFDVLRDRSIFRVSSNLAHNTQTQFQFILKSRKRSFNNKKTIENQQNDDVLRRHNASFQFCNKTWEIKKKYHNVVFDWFSNQKIRFAYTLEFITQCMRFNVLQLVQHRFSFVVRKYWKRKNLFLHQFSFKRRSLICEICIKKCMFNSHQNRE